MFEKTQSESKTPLEFSGIRLLHEVSDDIFVEHCKPENKGALFQVGLLRILFFFIDELPGMSFLLGRVAIQLLRVYQS